MASKLSAAQVAASGGVETVISSGLVERPITRVLKGLAGTRIYLSAIKPNRKRA